MSDEPAAMEALSRDFSGVVRKRPGVIVRPQSAADVAQTVRYALAQGLTVTTRAMGHSCAGQSLSEGGILLDMRSLDRLHELDPPGRWFRAGAGTPWSRVVGAATAEGLIPPVLTDYHHASLGGTHSAGGWGSSSFRYGTQADQCIALEVVTGTGEVVRCSREEERDLFEHTLCGQGQFGVITQVWHSLRRYLPVARTYTLLYRTLSDLLGDCRVFLTESRFDHINCRIQSLRRAPGHDEWYYLVRATVEAKSPEAVRDADLLSGLRFSYLFKAEEMPTQRFLRALSLDPVEGQPGRASPWMDLFLPWSQAQGYIADFLARLPELSKGLSVPMQLMPAARDRVRMPLFCLPDEEMAVGLGVYHEVGAEQTPEALRWLGAASDLGLGLGAKHYLATWVDFDLPRWRRQFREYWPTVNHMKARFDPQGVLNPGRSRGAA